MKVFPVYLQRNTLRIWNRLRRQRSSQICLYALRRRPTWRHSKEEVNEWNESAKCNDFKCVRKPT